MGCGSVSNTVCINEKVLEYSLIQSINNLPLYLSNEGVIFYSKRANIERRE